MRSFLLLLTSAFAAALLVPAAAGAATIPCVQIIGIDTCAPKLPDPTAPVPEAPARPACAGQDDRPTPATFARARRATLCLLNRERKEAGRRAVRASGSLRRAATSYARRMVRDGFFSHVGPSGDTLRDRIRRSSYLTGARRWTVGENLAWGTAGAASPATIVASWMASPGHRRNVLGRSFKHVGIGLATGAPTDAPGGVTYVTEYGSRR